MQRIVILGNAGSGKSTLARALGERLDLAVVHMDLVFWETAWREPDTEVFRQRVRAAIAGDRWVSEGNYAAKTFDLRMSRADCVVWLDTPRSVCLRRVLLRTGRGLPRVDLPADCIERLDLEFLKFLRFIWDFDSKTRPGIERERLARGADVPVVHLKSAREVAAFLEAPPLNAGYAVSDRHQSAT